MSFPQACVNCPECDQQFCSSNPDLAMEQLQTHLANFHPDVPSWPPPAQTDGMLTCQVCPTGQEWLCHYDNAEEKLWCYEQYQDHLLSSHHPVDCLTDAECPEGYKCQGGKCVMIPGGAADCMARSWTKTTGTTFLLPPLRVFRDRHMPVVLVKLYYRLSKFILDR